jgi:acetyl esterase/lipase
MLIRFLFERSSAKTLRRLAPFRPSGVAVITDERYRDGDAEALLDVYRPSGAGPDERLPAVVWVHGGAWLSGDKADVSPYYELLAAEGYVVVAVNYSLAPRSNYPLPLHQVDAALSFIRSHAARLGADEDRIFIAGDSAGAQITSQIALAITDPVYARELRLTPSIKPEQLRGVILHCGFYDLQTFVDRGRLAPVAFLRWGVATMLKAYLGHAATDPVTIRQMSATEHLSSAFPPTFISGGNGDPLTVVHSRPLAARLRGLGVEVTTLFFDDEHEPRLAHEYQFDLTLPDAQEAMRRTLSFLMARSS